MRLHIEPRIRIKSTQGVSREHAIALMGRPYTSVSAELARLYPALRDVNGIAGFALIDVVTTLGPNYEARLRDSGVAVASVSTEHAKAYGYSQNPVLIDIGALDQVSRRMTMRLRQDASTPLADGP